MIGLILGIVVALWIAWTALSVWMATSKGYPASDGVLLGLLLGVFSLLVWAFRKPAREPAADAPRRRLQGQDTMGGPDPGAGVDAGTRRAA
jgi:hypothetical protein